MLFQFRDDCGFDRGIDPNMVKKIERLMPRKGSTVFVYLKDGSRIAVGEPEAQLIRRCNKALS